LQASAVVQTIESSHAAPTGSIEWRHPAPGKVPAMQLSVVHGFWSSQFIGS